MTAPTRWMRASACVAAALLPALAWSERSASAASPSVASVLPQMFTQAGRN